MKGLIDLNSADMATLVQELSLARHRAELLLARRPFWDFSEVGQLAGFGPTTIARLRVIARVVPPPPIDINSCSVRELTRLPGIGPALARRISTERPFHTLEDLTRIKGISKNFVSTLRRRVVAVELPRLDLNRATETELRGLPGIGKSRARQIVGQRPFRDIDDFSTSLHISQEGLERLSGLIAIEAQLSDGASHSGETEAVQGKATQSSTDDLHHPQSDHQSAPQDRLDTITGAPAPGARVDFDQVEPALEKSKRIKFSSPPWPEPVVEIKPPQSEEWVDRHASRDILRDISWVVVEEPGAVSSPGAAIAPDLHPTVMPTLEFDVTLQREIMRRMPLFISGWVVAAFVLLIVLGMYAFDLLRFGPPDSRSSISVPATDAVERQPVVQVLVPTVTPVVPSVLVAAITPPIEPTTEPTPPPTQAQTGETAAVSGEAHLAPLAHLGTPIFAELFAPGDYWELDSTDLATMVIEQDRLSITMLSTNAVVWTRNGHGGSDFYFQGTVIPENCRTGDYFGLVFRSVSDLDLYLFGVSCTGEYRVVKRAAGQFEILMDFTPEASILDGEQLNLLGVWAAGPELYFYVNDVPVLGLTDGIISDGRFGVFAKASSNADLTVHYDDLAAWEIAP